MAYRRPSARQSQNCRPGSQRGLPESASLRLWRAGRLLGHPWLLVLLWMALIFAGSSWASPPSGPTPVIDFFIKKSTHFAEFGILALLVRRALVTRLAERHWTAFVGALLLTAAYAVTDEVHQSLTPNRFPSAMDVGVDVLGGLAFLLAAQWYHQNVAK